MRTKGKTANLKPFKKGQDDRRNTSGRPKKIPGLDTILAEVLGYADGHPEVTGRAIKILEALARKAERGDVRAAEVLLDRAYGKARNNIDVTSKGMALNPNGPHAEIDYTQLSEKALKEILGATKLIEKS